MRRSYPYPVATSSDAVEYLLGESGGALMQFATTSVVTARFDTKALVAAATIPASVNAVSIAGYTSAGDGGAALYKRVVSEPSHAGKIQSNDGAWWELAEAVVNPFMFGAAGDGSTDDYTVFAAMDAAGFPILLPSGVFFIGTDITLSSPYHILAGAMFKPNASVTITFSDCVDAPPAWLFDLSAGGDVAGLSISHAEWFAADVLNTTTDATSRLEIWANSVVQGGTLRVGLGYYTLAGADYIDLTKAQYIVGQSRDSSTFLFSGTATRGFRWQTSTGGGIINCYFNRHTPYVFPTAGACVFFESGSEQLAENVTAWYCYIGVQTNSFGTKLERLTIINCASSSIKVQDCNETDCQNTITGGGASYATLTTIVGGPFTQDETVTFTGGTGTIYHDGAGNYMLIVGGSWPAALPVTITGASSGATASLTNLERSNQEGSILIDGICHAGMYVNCECSGGDIGLYMLGTSASDAGLANTFVNSLFDSARTNSVKLVYGTGTKFVNCWFSSFGPCTLDVSCASTKGASFVGCHWANTWTSALSNINGDAENTLIDNCIIADTNTSSTAGAFAIVFAAGSSGCVANTIVGADWGAGGAVGDPQKGVAIDTGAVVTLDNVDVSLCADASKIFDNSGGTARIRNCPGWKTEAVGSSSVAFGADGEANIAHGMAETPVWAQAHILGDNANEATIVSLSSTNIRVRNRNSTSDADQNVTVTVGWRAASASAVG
jgi:hypothetical protein